MDLLTFGIIAFVIYRIVRSINPDQWRRLMEEAQKQQNRGSQQKDAIEVDASEWVRDLLSTKADHTGDTVTPILERHMITDKEPDTIFEENQWRRQLFIVCLAIGIGYLVYLIVI